MALERVNNELPNEDQDMMNMVDSDGVPLIGPTSDESSPPSKIKPLEMMTMEKASWPSQISSRFGCKALLQLLLAAVIVGWAMPIYRWNAPSSLEGRCSECFNISVAELMKQVENATSSCDANVSCI
jgi:hypothetical protein